MSEVLLVLLNRRVPVVLVPAPKLAPAPAPATAAAPVPAPEPEADGVPVGAADDVRRIDAPAAPDPTPPVPILCPLWTEAGLLTEAAPPAPTDEDRAIPIAEDGCNLSLAPIPFPAPSLLLIAPS